MTKEFTFSLKAAIAQAKAGRPDLAAKNLAIRGRFAAAQFIVRKYPHFCQTVILGKGYPTFTGWPKKVETWLNPDHWSEDNFTKPL